MSGSIPEEDFRYYLAMQSKVKKATSAQTEINRKQWTFLSNHGHVLVHVSRYPDSLIRDIANTVGITERSAQAIISDLAEAGYIRVVKKGRKNTYKINATRKFRHPSESNESIGSLISIFQ
jgi:DNA-binding MarR family transcriptional regulator